MHPLIISRLIESGYQVFFPIGGGNELLVRDLDGEIKTCVARTASTNDEHSSVLKNQTGFDLIAAYDPATKNVWIIPSNVLENMTAIRLGRKYEEYLIPEPVSMEYRDRRKDRVRYYDSLKEKASKLGKEHEEND